MDDVEAAIQTRVRIGGADHDRVTGNAIWANCIHRTTRPVSAWQCQRGSTRPCVHAALVDPALLHRSASAVLRKKSDVVQK